MDLSGKVALLTGASSGIGRAVAILFAKLHARLALFGRNEDELQKTLKRCEDESRNSKNDVSLGFHISVKVDLSDVDQIYSAYKKAIDHFGRLDILINNAGIQIPDSVEEFDVDKYQHLMDVNVRSVLLLTNIAIPKLAESKGVVVNLSSAAGNRAFPGVMSYCISKAAIEQFTRSAALALAPKGIRVNAVAPGVIVTSLHKRAGMSDDDYTKFLERTQITHPLGRPGTADEVANAIAFLASNTSSFTTGMVLPVDGGWSIITPR